MYAALTRSSLLVRFALLSLLSVAALAVVLGGVLSGRIRERALEAAEGRASTLAHMSVGTVLAPHVVAGGLTEAELERVDALLTNEHFRGLGVERIKFFDRDGRLVYSDDRGAIGASAAASEGLARALRGQTVSEVEDGGDYSGQRSQTLEVYVPLRGMTSGVFEVYLSYAPVAAEIREETRVLYLSLGVGFIALFAVLFRIVAGASRKLRRQADANRHQALHDPLTDLPNRRLLLERVAETVEAGAGGDRVDAVILVDLDHFRDVNDTLGHDAGDRLIEQVADRLRTVVREGDTLARLGGDEFALVVGGARDRGVVGEIALRVAREIERPMMLDGVAVCVDASIGVAIHPDHGHDAATLLKHADVAMYQAKRSRARVETYRPEDDPHTADRLALAGEIRRAIEEGELVLHYQPLVDLVTGRVCAVEALVRWEHPERGLIPPMEFIPLAERTGSIGPMTYALLDAALRQLRAWRDEGLYIGVSVNLAGPTMADPALPERVAALLERWDVAPERLCFEISERAVMDRPEPVGSVLGALARMGVKLSLDDFGTGHSSLAHLKRLPIGELKIDRSFVMHMADDPGDATIVASTIWLARSLGMSVVAEGVEDRRTLEALEALRCDVAQGYHLGRPVPAAELDLAALAR